MPYHLSFTLPFGQRNNTSLQIFHKLLTSQTRSGLTEFAVVLEHQPLLQSSKLMPPGKQTTIKTTHSAIRTTLQQAKIINKHTLKQAKSPAPIDNGNTQVA